MISKISKGKGFAGAIRYDRQKAGARVIDSNLAGSDPDEQAREMRAVADQNPSCKRPVFHASLSVPPGEKLTDEQWAAVGREYLNKMGFANNQYVITRHVDTEHDHIHIVANRVNLDNDHAVNSDKRDFARSQDGCREIEKRYGLTVTPSHGRKVAQGRGREGENEGLLANMRGKIARSARESGGNLDKFTKGCERQGVGVRLNQSKATGNVTGISFIDLGGGKAFKGSELGRGFSWKGISSKLEKSRHHSDTEIPRPPIGGSSGVATAAKKAIHKVTGGKTKPTAFVGAVVAEMRKIRIKDFQHE